MNLMELQTNNLSATDKWMLVILDYCHQNSLSTSYQSLSNLSLLTVSGVTICLRRLLAKGYIRKQANQDPDTHGTRSNTYTLDLEGIQPATEGR